MHMCVSYPYLEETVLTRGGGGGGGGGGTPEAKL